jgi:hypothetical protein
VNFPLLGHHGEERLRIRLCISTARADQELSVKSRNHDVG